LSPGSSRATANYSVTYWIYSSTTLPRSLESHVLLNTSGFCPIRLASQTITSPAITLKKKKRPKHREFTDTVTQAISSSRLTCIITDGLDAFSGSCPRLKRFLQRLGSLICFIHIFTMVPSSVRSISGPGFACGTLADGRYYASLHSHGLLAQTPSLKVEMLFASFKQLHNNNHAPVKKTRSL
jgi:hypothetical protein